MAIALGNQGVVRDIREFIYVEKRDRWIFSGLLGLIIALLALDAREDLRHGAALSHVLEEAVLVAFCLAGILYLWRRFFRFRTENLSMQREVGRLRDDLASYKRETAHLMEELGARIEAQLRVWGLTEAEQGVQVQLVSATRTPVKTS